MENKTDSKLVCIIGAPSSGKSTLATSVHHSLKVQGKNSIFVGEAATDYIAEWGIPNTPLDQIVIFYQQLGREKDIAVINHVQKEILKTLDQWHRIYYVPPVENFSIKDGIRFHNQEEIGNLDSIIRSYLMMEKIEFVDLSDIDIEDRSSFIIKDLLK